MVGRKLKHFEKYLDKLNNYADALGIKIKYTDTEDEGSFSSHRKCVKVDGGLSHSGEIATILHELGHASDPNIVGPDNNKSLDDAYAVVYVKKPTNRQLNLVVEAEEKAWLYGRTIAKMLRIPLGKWYDQEEKESLDTYKDLKKEL